MSVVRAYVGEPDRGNPSRDNPSRDNPSRDSKMHHSERSTHEPLLPSAGVYPLRVAGTTYLLVSRLAARRRQHAGTHRVLPTWEAERILRAALGHGHYPVAAILRVVATPGYDGGRPRGRGMTEQRLWGALRREDIVLMAASTQPAAPRRASKEATLLRRIRHFRKDGFMHQGRTYRLASAASLAAEHEQEGYELLPSKEAAALLAVFRQQRELRPEQRECLEQAAELLTEPSHRNRNGGLVLLRRRRVIHRHTAPEVPLVTPAQLRQMVEKQIDLRNPRWEHLDPRLQASRPDKAAEGDRIRLLADGDGFPQGAPVDFDVFDEAIDAETRYQCVRGSYLDGLVSADWTVSWHPKQQGDAEDAKLKFLAAGEAHGQSKETERAPVPLLDAFRIILAYDRDEDGAEDDELVLYDEGRGEVERIPMVDLPQPRPGVCMLTLFGLDMNTKYSLVRDYDLDEEGDEDSIFVKRTPEELMGLWDAEEGPAPA